MSVSLSGSTWLMKVHASDATVQMMSALTSTVTAAAPMNSQRTVCERARRLRDVCRSAGVSSGRS